MIETERADERPAITPSNAERVQRLDDALAERYSTGAHGQGQPQGRNTARERIALLVDDGTFQEIEGFRRHRATGFGLENRRPYTDGVVAGWAKVNGRHIMISSQDIGVYGGSLGEAQAEKIHKVIDLAIRARVPLVSILDGGGARIQEGARSLAGYGGIFRRHVQATRRIPQISVVLGACAGGAAYGPALTDFVFAVSGTSHLFVTGPDVVRTVTGEDVDKEGLGGAQVHCRTGVVSFVHNDEKSCLDDVQFLLSLLPDNCDSLPPEWLADDPADRQVPGLLSLVPAGSNKSYDMKKVIEIIVDDGEHLEYAEAWAPNIVCSFARMGGASVGIVANQPAVMAGVLDIAASEKAARFIDLCDSFNIPIVSLVDVPGFLPGVGQEHHGLIRHGAKLLRAYCQATVPRLQVILRKAYGGAYIVMDSRSIGADLSFAWPGNEIAVMGAEGAAAIIFRRRIEESLDPNGVRVQLANEYHQKLSNPLHAAEEGLVDEVINPADTRRVIIDSLNLLRGSCSRENCAFPTA